MGYWSALLDPCSRVLVVLNMLKKEEKKKVDVQTYVDVKDKLFDS